MKRFLIIFSILIALVVVGVLIFIFVSKPSTPEPTNQSQQEDPFGVVTGSGSNSGMVPLKLDTGAIVYTQPFVPEEQPDWAGPSGYQVAGTNESAFLITYIEPDAYGSQAQFLINLQEEPLGQNRKDAESALRNSLRLTDSQICELDVQVWTAPGVSDVYSGRNLGLSFCDGSVKLP